MVIHLFFIFVVVVDRRTVPVVEVFIDIDLLSDSDMLTILSDGFINDLLLSVYSDIGLPLNKPYSSGYITPTVCYWLFS